FGARLGGFGGNLMAGESDIPLTWGAQLTHAERTLAESGSPSPQHEAVELLGHLLGLPVSEILARRQSPMRHADARRYHAWVTRRAGGVPMPYVTGHLEFMGLDISIGWDSPLPFPGASRLVEAALEWARSRAPEQLIAAEMRTGCGAIALALAALEPRFIRIYALDASPQILAVAAANGARYLLNLVIHWVEGETLDALSEPVDLIVCGQYDPALPPFSGQLLARLPAKLRPAGALMCLLEAGRAEAYLKSFRNHVPEQAQVWTTPPSDGALVAVAQLPRSPSYGV
ncbi:MAG TPA: class I SAM-dependent methyltransferase, partial [Ktedonobacterales bacterium]|nr:class I SAM-dependent methyltransferase [Ktedonobacterales bacterium]